MKKTNIIMRTIKYWNSLPRVMVERSSLEMLMTVWQDPGQPDLRSCFEQNIVQDLQRSLSPWTFQCFLQFYEILESCNISEVWCSLQPLKKPILLLAISSSYKHFSNATIYCNFIISRQCFEKLLYSILLNIFPPLNMTVTSMLGRNWNLLVWQMDENQFVPSCICKDGCVYDPSMSLLM